MEPDLPEGPNGQFVHGSTTLVHLKVSDAGRLRVEGKTQTRTTGKAGFWRMWAR